MCCIKSIIGVLPILLILGACQQERAENLTFSDWDEDGDGIIRESEFVDIFSENYYNDWNRTDNEYLDDEDFYHIVYSVWDADEDDQLNRDEWAMGYDYFYGHYVAIDYDDIDVNADEFISRDEFNEIVKDTDFFTDWDTNEDKRISEAELAAKVFEHWDLDNSGTLDLEEYQKFDMYYLDI